MSLTLDANASRLAEIAERAAGLQLGQLLAELAAELAILGARVDELERNDAHDAGSPWLSVRGAAVYLRISERTLERLISRGRVRSTVLGRRRLLHRDDLDALAMSGGGRGASANPLHPAVAEE